MNNLLKEITKKFSTREEQNKAIKKLVDSKYGVEYCKKEGIDHEEFYEMIISSRDEYLEYLEDREIELLLDDDYQAELYVAVCEEIDAAKKLMEKPGWAMLDLCITKRNLETLMSTDPEEAKRLDDEIPYPDKTMSDLEMAKITGYTRGRIVQETMRCKRLLRAAFQKRGLTEELFNAPETKFSYINPSE